LTRLNFIEPGVKPFEIAIERRGHCGIVSVE
jgi:hypothetical protein